MPLASGSRLGFYEVLSPLGSGGMGELPCSTDEANLSSLLGLVAQILLLPSGEKDGMRGRFSPMPMV